MPAQRINWNVLILGAWNLAILTPDGIRKRLFQLPEGTPIQIEVGIDQPGAFRVVQDGIIVAPTLGTLDITMERNEMNSMQSACGIGIRAIEALPETPFSAAGINFRYSIAPVEEDLIDLVKAPWEDAISDQHLAVRGSLTQRTMTCDPGEINAAILVTGDGTAHVTLNFHRASTNATELIAWLARAEEFSQISERILRSININIED